MEPPLFRIHLGSALRSVRMAQGHTLREVSTDAGISLGYLSEVERGCKEVSSEMLASICEALEVPLWRVLVLAARASASPVARSEVTLRRAA